jgi:sulfide:quinone oxidoreductase
MKHLVVLGAGTAGALIANLLVHKLNGNGTGWTVTVIDRSADHVYQPGLLFIPFRLYDYQSRDDVVKPIRSPLSRGIRFIQAEVKAVDPDHKQVETDAGTLHYDWLVSALGCRLAPEDVEGMAEAMGEGNVHTFYSLDGALALQRALDEMQEGRLVINAAEMPIKCPVAPIEFAFLADYYFHLRGIRDRVEITLVTPLSGAFTKLIANRVLTEVAERKQIRVVPNFAISRVDPTQRRIHSFEGDSLDYDLLCAIPPNVGPTVIEESGLGDGSGYALTDPKTLRSRKADYVYAIGDNTNVATSKAGSVAHFEAETVVENILREVDGKPPLPSFDGHVNCFIESGFHKALFIDFNYDTEPVSGSFPLPYVGPLSLLRESYANHLGKLAFKWMYWHLLLPGRLGHVPLLPAHMSFVGKNLAEVGPIRRARTMQVRDLMTQDVVTVRAGASLTEAARLMTQHKISGLPVVDVDDRVVGVLTESDFVCALEACNTSAVRQAFELLCRRSPRMGTTVDNIMTRNAVTIGEDETLQQAAERMEQHGIKRLIVTDPQQRLRGVLSRADLMKLFLMKG